MASPKKTAIKKSKPPAKAPADLAHIAPALHHLVVPIGTLTPDPQNARTHDDRNRDAIAKSLARFGQQKPIVFDEGRVVRAGNGTLQAAITLGWTMIAAVQTNLTGPELDAYEIADNRTAELAGWDPAELNRQLQDLAEQGIDAELLAFTAAELEELVKRIPTDPAEAPPPSGSTATPHAPPRDQFKILIECRDEMHQTELLDRFDQEGLKAKALVG